MRIGKSKEKTLGTWWLINQGQTLIIVNGGHALMGGNYALGAIQIQTDYFIKNLIRNRSFGE